MDTYSTYHRRKAECLPLTPPSLFDSQTITMLELHCSATYIKRRNSDVIGCIYARRPENQLVASSFDRGPIRQQRYPNVQRSQLTYVRTVYTSLLVVVSGLCEWPIGFVIKLDVMGGNGLDWSGMGWDCTSEYQLTTVRMYGG